MKLKIYIASMMMCLGSMSVYSSNLTSEFVPQDENGQNLKNASGDDNILNSWIFGFEPVVKMVNGNRKDGSEWFFQHKNNFSVTEEKAPKGKHCLKYSLTQEQFDETQPKGNLQIQNAYDKAIVATPDIADGEYVCTVNFWLEDKAPSIVNVTFISKSSGLFIPATFKLDGVERGKWVTLSKAVKLREMHPGLDRRVYVSVPSAAGVGTCYIDDIRLVTKENAAKAK